MSAGQKRQISDIVFRSLKYYLKSELVIESFYRISCVRYSEKDSCTVILLEDT